MVTEMMVVEQVEPGSVELAPLVASHLAFAGQHSPPEHVHAYDGERLATSSLTMVGVRVDGALVGMGAVQDVEPGHVELKSMHVLPSARGQGVARAIVTHLLELAVARGATRASLETGSMEAFAPARRLYASFGFEECEPFGDYTANDYSVCMTRALPV